MAFQVRPWLDLAAREFQAGRFPAWDPYLWGGQSLIGQVQPGVANPLNWLLFALPLRDGHIPPAALQWYWVIIHWLGAAWAYALCRDLGAGLGSSLLGGCLFALTGYLGHTDWPQMLMSAIWTPLVLLFLLRMFRGLQPWRSAVWGGAALGAAFLGGHHSIPIYTALLAGLLWLWWLAKNRKSRTAWSSAALFWTVSLLISAFQVLPAVEYGRLAVRWVGAPEPVGWHDRVPLAIHAQYSLPLGSLAGMVIPAMWDGLPVNPYVGMVGALMAVTALVRGWRTRQVRLLAAAVGFGLLIALGIHTPIYRALYTVVPLMEKARTPAMAIVLAHLGIAAMAAVGLDSIGRHSVKASPGSPGMGARSRPRFPLAAPMFVPPLVFAIFLLEAVYAAPHFARFDRPGSYSNTIHDQEDIAAFLKQQPGWFRIEADEKDVPYNFGDWFGVEQFGGYLASMPEKTFRMLGRKETTRLFGIQYRIGRSPASAEQVLVFRSRSGLNVYRDPRIPEPLWSECARQLRIIERLPDRFLIDADMRCAGPVIAGDPKLPGWRARIDGRPVSIDQYQDLLRSVTVSSGKHRIEFRYRPASLYWGGALSLSGLLLAAWLSVRSYSGTPFGKPPA